MNRAARLFLTASLFLAAAAPVAAGGPVRIPTDLFNFTLPGGVFCDFDLEVDNFRGTQTVMLYETPDGSFVTLVVGPVLVALTNLDTGATIEASISGPLRVVEGDETTVAGTGRWLLFRPFEGVWLTSGWWDGIDGAASGLATLRGTAVDVCAALA